MKEHKFAQRFFTVAIAALTLFSLGFAQKVSESELQFREALHKQQVQGDLASAIKLYQSLASSKTADRALKAKALLQLADCYETLGRQAESVYQQIVRDFADQPAATQARAKLAAMRPPAAPATMTLRKIEMGDGVQNVVATDSQRAVYWDSTNTKLLFGDIAGKEKRVVFQTSQDPRVVVSRDLSVIFLYFARAMQEPAKFAVVKSDGTGYRELKLIENGAPLRYPTAPNVSPLCMSWSWDQRYLLMCLDHRLLRISLTDGHVQELLPEGRNGVSQAQFSPDGRYIAYNESPVGPGSIYIIPADGGEPHLVANQARLVDWTRDGRHLLIAQPGSDLPLLFAIPISGGQSGGERRSLRSVPGFQARTLSNGSLLVSAMPGAGRVVWLGTLDENNKVSQWTQLNLIGYADNPSFSWSPDGGTIAYIAGRLTNTTLVLRLRNLSSGEDRELYRGRPMTCAWAHQHPRLYCHQPAGPNTDILSISVDSGRSEVVGTLDGAKAINLISRDDRTLNFFTGGGWSDWEIATGHEITAPYRSEDGRWTLSFAPDSENGRHARIRTASSDSGDWRPLMFLRMSAPSGFATVPIRFTPDGDWVVYHDKESDGKDVFYRVPTAGGEPERLGDFPTSATNSVISVSPDGRKFIAATSVRLSEPEFWVLENFLSTAQTSKTAGK
jgi:Tol biopolymer transport system component